MRRALLVIFGFILGGCAGVSAKLPEGYVQVPKEQAQPYALKAVSAKGNVFAMNIIENQKGGTLEFWTEAVENQLTRNKGYTVVTKQEFKTTQGFEGKEMLFSIQEKGLEYLYMVSLIVKSDKIYVFEAGGLKTDFENDLSLIRQYIRESSIR